MANRQSGKQKKPQFMSIAKPNEPVRVNATHDTFASLGRVNSIGFIRIAAATLVIFGHSFSYGSFGADPLLAATRNQITIGRCSVDVFFILSGFLISMSFQRTDNLVVYAWHRVLRIYPALVVCIAITGLILSPIFAGHADLRYVLKNILIIWGF